MRLPQIPPKLRDLIAEVKPPERLAELFSKIRVANPQSNIYPKYLHWDKLRHLSPPPELHTVNGGYWSNCPAWKV